MSEGLTKNRVLPLPLPPMTRMFLFRAYLGIFRAAGHGELFRLGQRNVPVGNRIDIGGNIGRRAPSCAAVLNALAIFLCILALGIHRQPNNDRPGDTRQQVQRMQTWQPEENASVKPWLKCRNFSEASRPGARRTAWQSLSKRYTNSRYGRLGISFFFQSNRHNSTPRSLVLTFSRWRCWALDCCFACSSSLRMEGFFSFSRFFAENSRKAAVITSASRPLKNTR